MVDFALSDEQKALVEKTRSFVQEHLLPTLRERENIADPLKRFPWDVVTAGSKLGLRTMAVPKKYGGPGYNHLTLCLIGEELAKADLGVAVIFDQTWKISSMFANFCTEEQYKRHMGSFLTDHEMLLAFGATEAQSGSDTFYPYDEPGTGIQMFAEKDGDHYILNGRKQFLSTVPEAKLYALLARTDKHKRPSEAYTAFIIPKGHPGFGYGIIHDKIGQRLINNGELILENCRVHKSDVLGVEGQFLSGGPDSALAKWAAGSNTEGAATALGVGQAAYEAALAYAKKRIQGGRPIIEHQVIGMMLAEMLTRLETARLLIWKAAWSIESDKPDYKLPKMAKVYASESSVWVAIKAMEIHGGSGIMKDLPMEKYLRDAITFLHSDGTNQVHLAIVQRLLSKGR